MIARLIELSVRNRLLVLLLTLLVAGLGAWSVHNIRLDAIPDLSDVQVIITTEYPGQSPSIVNDQVTYPLTTALLSVPGARDVRGFSMFEQSFVYVIFEDGTDIESARARVLEYLSFAGDRLPRGVQPKLGPDATGLGWVYQYVLYPGWYCPQHPQGIYHDQQNDKWYARPEDAPADRREALQKVRGFESAGTCPLTGEPLVQSDQDLGSLRSLQDWYLRYPLTAVPGVSEVASIGGFVKEYQVEVDPQRLQAYGLSVRQVADAIERSNNDVGGGVIEQAENELMVRSRAYLRGVEDIGAIVVSAPTESAMQPGRGIPVLLRDVAKIQIGGAARRGIGELDGRGEAVGGVVVARFGANAWQVIQDAKAKLAELETGLPPGVFIKTTYDRSALIDRAVGTLREAVIECLVVTALICLVFLFHIRSAVVAILVLPIGLLASIGLMNALGLNANIMSLGGLALAIGVMVDSAIVMIENVHKHIEEQAHEPHPLPRSEVILRAAQEVGPSLFFSLLIITVSFLPIFVLGGQAGRLFGPLAFTKTFAIGAGALLGVTLVPVLMVLLIRGRIPHEDRNPLNRFSQAVYEPAFWWVMRHPVLTLGVVLLLGASTIYPLTRIGSEFMPPLDEGDLLYMPTTDPSVSVATAKQILQRTDKLIAAFPEVQSVHGKIGRADTATDPAPLSMIETVVQLKPDHDQWRQRPVRYFFSDWPGWLKWPLTHSFFPERRPITTDELKFGWTDPDGTRHIGLNEATGFPGMANAWPFPIENRLAMLSTGIKTPVGIKVLGPDLQTLSQLADQVAAAVRPVQGTVSAFPERTTGGFYLDIDIHRATAARYGLTTGAIQDAIEAAIGGRTVTTVVDGPARYPLNLRYKREIRDDVSEIRDVLVTAPGGAAVPLGQLASIQVNPGPPMVRSENGQLAAYVFVDVAGRDLGSYVEAARDTVARQVALPVGYHLQWSGQFQQMQATSQRLRVIVPVTLVIVVLLLYISNRSWFRVGVVLLAVPFSLIGAIWAVYGLGYNWSVAVLVGMIALLGIDAETGQVMLLYLDTTFEKFRRAGRMRNRIDLLAAIHEGAVKRIRPKTMTVATDMIGLFPLLWASGTGADMMRRLVVPLVGGILVSFLMELLVYPVVFYLYHRWRDPALRSEPQVAPRQPVGQQLGVMIGENA